MKIFIPRIKFFIQNEFFYSVNSVTNGHMNALIDIQFISQICTVGACLDSHRGESLRFDIWADMSDASHHDPTVFGFFEVSWDATIA